MLTYTDAGAASSRVAALLHGFQRCSARLGPTWQVSGFNPPGSPDAYSLSDWNFAPGAVDEGFVIERFSEVVAPDGPAPNVNQLGAARDGNVVVVVESTGWGDRPSRTLEVALSRALGNQGGRCGVPELDHRQVECPDRL